MGPAQAFFLATMRNTQKLRENALFLSRVREDACQAPERGFGRAGSATGVRDGPGEARQAPYHLLPLSGEEDPPSHKHYPSFGAPQAPILRETPMKISHFLLKKIACGAL